MEPVQADFGLTLLLFAIVFLLKEFVLKKPEQEQAKPDGLGDFKFPTATENRKRSIIFGTVMVEGPNVIWSGDLQEEAIRESVKSGLFSKKTTITGFRYNLGIQMAICEGEVDELIRIRIGDTDIPSSGVVGPGTVVIDEASFLGGDEFGAGGISGTARFHTGAINQPVNSYLTAFQQEGGDTPAYVGLCYVVLEKGYIGNSSQIKPWSFEVRRIPDGLALPSGHELVNANDANPMNVLYELLTNTDWGLAQQAAQIDTTNFTAAAAILFNEGNGFSYILDRAQEANELKKELERQIDGIVFRDRATGLWKVTLARPGQASIGMADATNIIELKDFSRNSWADTTNQVRTQFADRSRDYFGTFAIAQDGANVDIVGGNRIMDQKYGGVKDPTLANNITWRTLRTVSRPFAKCALTMGRDFFNANPGDVFELADDTLGVATLSMRIIAVDLGQITAGRITIDAVENIFDNDAASFDPPQPTGWIPSSDTVVDIPLVDRAVFEAPKAISDRDPDLPGRANRLWAGARSQGNNEIQFDVDVSGNTEGTTVGFLLIGELNANIDGSDTSLVLNSDIDSSQLLFDEFTTVTATDKGVSLAQLVYMENGEFLFVTSASHSSPTVTLNSLDRGVLDTTPQSHTAGDRCYLVFVAGNLTDGTFTSSPTTDLLPESPSDKLTAVGSTDQIITMDDRHLRPYPPTRPRIVSVEYNTATVQLDSAVSALDDGLGFVVDFTRRDFRTSDEYLAQLSEATLPGDFPTANTTEYRVEVIDDPAGTPTSLFTTPWSADGDATNQIPISRTEILANNAAVVPTRLRISVETRHVIDAIAYTAQKNLTWDFDVNSIELDSGDQVLGTAANGVSLAAFIAPTTGTYTLGIGSDILVNGTLQENVNGGGFVNTAITAGVIVDATRSYTATDSVVFRINGETPALGLNTILKVDEPAVGDTSEGHGVFTL